MRQNEESCVLLSPSERTSRARLAAYEMHSRHDPLETTAKARATFIASFQDKVDPDHILPLRERARRAEAARKAFYTRASLKARRLRREQGNGGAV